MKFLEDFFENQKAHFEKGGKLEKLFPFFEMADTFIFTPSRVTKTSSHVRDGIDLKRTMITVAMALVPCILLAIYNTGYQANFAIGTSGIAAAGWRADIITTLGLGFSHHSIFANLLHGLLYFVPVFLVTNIAGGLWEGFFASIRGHEVNEGFLVTGLLFPLILPPTIPLWQVAVAISFGVVIGKEIYGGTGRNIFNPALLARAFLFFAYPAQISGEKVWTALDGFSGATPLAQAAAGGMDAITVTWNQAFMGMIPGSMGETSTLACLFGAIILIRSGIGSWRIMLSALIGMAAMTAVFNCIGSATNPMFGLTISWHMVLGGFAFAVVFMATDPVSAAATDKGRFIYGFLIGVLGVLIRVVNPAYPEGWMLAILFMNAFSPLIDHFVMQGNIKKRRVRNG
jgi:Na+-transporting NADH:ubiquinone oxidoreductase subunit B